MKKLYLDKFGIIEKERLRVEVLTKLKDLKQQAERLLHDERYQDVWRRLHDLLITTYTGEEKESLLTVEAQLKTQDLYLEIWQKTAVESPERFEMFIRTKAAEIHSGDEKADYYWALKIRHDQLVALLAVEQALVSALTKFVISEVNVIVDDPRFQGLRDFPVETQVFLEAEQVQHERERLENRSH